MILKSNRSAFWFLTVILSLNGATQLTSAAPVQESTFQYPLELQPPLSNPNTDITDSYGNPIDTPDGRKIVNAKGIQFEIPNYASGITDVRKPLDDLQPPFLASNNKQTVYEENPFKDATIPPWLVDLNDPDVGPGVPYVITDDVKDIQDVAPARPTTKSPLNLFNPPVSSPAQPTLGGLNKNVQGTLTSNSIFPSSPTASTALKTTTFSQSPSSGFQFQNNLSPSSPSPFRPFPSKPSTNFLNIASAFQKSTTQATNAQVPGKYTGGFGGAPGVLGQQSTAGFAVRPKPIATPAPFVPAPSIKKPVIATEPVVKYTGGFGGPPGILSPYDNVKSR